MQCCPITRVISSTNHVLKCPFTWFLAIHRWKSYCGQVVGERKTWPPFLTEQSIPSLKGALPKFYTGYFIADIITNTPAGSAPSTFHSSCVPLDYFLHRLCSVGIILLILYMQNLRPREGSLFVCGHKGGKREGWDSNPGLSGSDV